MGKRIAMETNQLAAFAMAQIDPDVVAAYPITPSTEVVQEFSKYVANGEVSTEFVPVESEHSAISACLGAATAGARVMTATASQGLALMNEILHIASSARAPISVVVATRALSGPINIHGDHMDISSIRDAGWIIMMAEDAQEAYDNIIQSIPIAERAKFPIITGYDGFITSHAVEVAEVLEKEEVQKFIGPKKPDYSVFDEKLTIGVLALQDSYIEFKRKQAEDYDKVIDIVKQVGKEYGELTGRYYDTVEKYMTDDAEVIMVVMGSTAGTARVVVDQMRAEGHKVGLLKIRLFRPVPKDDIVSVLRTADAVMIMDRAYTYGGVGGPLFEEISAAMNDLPCRPYMANYIYGLGGRDIKPSHIRQVFEDGLRAVKGCGFEQQIKRITVRE